MLSEKGKYAAATENRRFVWAEIIWPLILEINDITFTLKQFQEKRERVCKEKNTTITIASRGLVSLVLKGILLRENDSYAINYKISDISNFTKYKFSQNRIKIPIFF